MIDISIIIVSWNSKDYLSGCLSSLAAGAGSLSFETFVVDNASGDGSADLARERFPSVHLIRNAENRGFAAANNQALKISSGRYALLLNPDTRVYPGAIESVVGFMDGHPEAGASGCLLLNEDGSVQHAVRRFPTFAFALGAKTILGRMGLFRKGYGSVKMRGEHFDGVMEVDQPSGAALFLRQSVLAEVGLLDEGYFMFFEEVDLCRRIKDAGHKIYLFPEARITHYGGRSRRQSRAEVILPGLQSMLRYFRKHEGPVRSALFDLVFRPLFAIGICFDAGRAALRISLSRLRPHRGMLGVCPSNGSRRVSSAGRPDARRVDEGDANAHRLGDATKQTAVRRRNPSGRRRLRRVSALLRPRRITLDTPSASRLDSLASGWRRDRAHYSDRLLEKEARLHAYCAFIKRDLIKFLTTPWE